MREARRALHGAQPKWSLVVAVLGATMVSIDATVVNVALPAMQRALNGTVTEMQWIVEAYTLLLASLVLVGGALGDRLGRKRVFLAGVILFAVASAACAAAPNATVLVLSRGVQGAGGALLVPGSLALISAAYAEHARGRAIATWSAASAITTAVAPVLGGWVVMHASWRWLFVINVPIGAFILLLAARRIAETRDDSAPAKIDLIGALLAILGLGTLVFALLDSPNAGGLASARTLILLAIGLSTLGAFVLVQARRRHPMVPLRLFRSRTFAATNLLTLLFYAALSGGFFFIPFDLIQVQGYSPAEAGACLLPSVVLLSSMSPAAGAIVARHGARLPLVVGPLIAACGFALLALPSTGGSYWTTFFPAMVVLGAGLGATIAPATTAVMGSVGAQHAGVASGANNAVSRAAGLLAVAGLGVVITARFNHVLDQELDSMAASPSVRSFIDAKRAELAGADLSGAEPAVRAALRHALDHAYVAGFQRLMLVCAGLSVAAAIVAAIFVDRIASQRRST